MFDDPAVWLPFVFAALMGLSIVIYVVLDGFDLGVGVLFPFADDDGQAHQRGKDEGQPDGGIGKHAPYSAAVMATLAAGEAGLMLTGFPSAYLRAR